MEKCINYECEDNDPTVSSGCEILNDCMGPNECKFATTKEFAEIEIDALTEMRDKLIRQEEFIKTAIKIYPGLEKEREKYFKESINE